MRQIRRPSGRLIHVCIEDRGFWHFPVKSGIAPAWADSPGIRRPCPASPGVAGL